MSFSAFLMCHSGTVEFVGPAHLPLRCTAQITTSFRMRERFIRPAPITCSANSRSGGITGREFIDEAVEVDSGN